MLLSLLHNRIELLNLPRPSIVLFFVMYPSI
jgi:hypothetical protein